MSWHQSIFNEVKGIVLATWTELTADQVFTSIEALRMNIISEAQGAANGDTDKQAAPYAIVDIGDYPNADGYSLDSETRFVQLTIYYFDSRGHHTSPSQDNQSYFAGKVELVQEAIEANTATTFQWMGVRGHLDSSQAVGFVEGNYNFQGAKVAWDSSIITVIQ